MSKHIDVPLLLLSVLIVATLSGVIGAVAMNRAIDRYVENIAQDSSLVRVSRERGRPLPGSYEQALESIRRYSLKTVGVLELQGEEGDWVEYPEVDALGVVITSDGWLAFHEDAVPNALIGGAVMDGAMADGVYVWVDGDRYAVEKVVAGGRGITMVKVGGGDFSVVTIGDASEFLGGEYVFGSLDGTTVRVGMLVDAFADVVDGKSAPAEVDRYHWEVDGVENGPLFGASGDILAIAHEGEALSLGGRTQELQALVRSGEYAPISAGFETVPVIHANGVGYGEKVANISGENALLVLQEGDVIVAVDDVPLELVSPLSSRISAYNVGGKVKITILRDGERQDILLTL